MTAQRGRVKLAELAPGEQYFAIYSNTGVCVFKTRSKEQAEEIVGRRPERLEYREHSR